MMSESSSSEALQLNDFDPSRLKEELLSLGNPKITQHLAQKISLEVERELEGKKLPFLTAEIISNHVRFKLEELGLLELRSPKARLKKSPAEKIERTHARNAPVRLEIKKPGPLPSPIKLQWSNESLEHFSTLKIGPAQEYLENLSKTIAAFDVQYEPEINTENTSILFFNALANLDFLPGTAIFKTQLKSGQIQSSAVGLKVPLEEHQIYETLKKIEEHHKAGFKLSLGLKLTEETEATSINSPELFLKLLKTTLEYDSESNFQKQDLFLEFSPEQKLNDLENTHQLIDWLSKEENHQFFSLSFGVPGRVFERPAENSSFQIALQGLLKRSFKAYPALRLFFQKRSTDSAVRPNLKNEWIPNLTSPSPMAEGELSPWGFLNLANMIENEEINWDKFRRTIRLSIHFLDNVLDCWGTSAQAFARVNLTTRPIGLGVMGLADLFFKLRIPYDSEEAVYLSSQIAEFLSTEAIKASRDLAKIRGVFPSYIGSLWQKREIPIRNSKLTALFWDPFPASIAQVAPGLETHPVLVARNTEASLHSRFLIHPLFAEAAAPRGFLSEEVLENIAREESVRKVEEVPQDLRKVFVCTSDISWISHLAVAEAFQKNFDGSVAKLCPVPAKVIEENFDHFLSLAYHSGLEGIWLKRIGEFTPHEEIVTPEIVEEPEAQEILPEIEETVIVEPEIFEEEEYTPGIAGHLLEIEEELSLLHQPEKPEEDFPPLRLVDQAFVNHWKEEPVSDTALNPVSFDPMMNEEILEEPEEDLTEIVPSEEFLKPSLEVEEQTEILNLASTEEADFSDDATVIVQPHTFESLEEEREEEEEEELTVIEARPSWILVRERPEVLTGITRRYLTACGPLSITLNEDDRGLFEVLLHSKPSSGCNSHYLESLSRLTSLSLRAGIDPSAIQEELRHLSCTEHGSKNEAYPSYAHALAHALELYFQNKVN